MHGLMSEMADTSISWEEVETGVVNMSVGDRSATFCNVCEISEILIGWVSVLFLAIWVFVSRS